MRSRVRGKGARGARVEGTKERKRPSDILTIGSLSGPSSFSAGETAPATKIENGDRLLPQSSFFVGKIPAIQALMANVYSVNSHNLVKQVEVEVRLHRGSSASDLDVFERVLRWLLKLYPNVQAVQFQEETHLLPVTIFGSDYLATAVKRGETEIYAKLKNKSLVNISLPAVNGCIPTIGVAVEILNFHGPGDAIPPEISKRKRWSFPISLQRIDGKASATIDLTVSEFKGTVIYEIEIELDSEGLQPRSEMLTHRFELSKVQIDLLDEWMKRVLTVMNKTGVFLTTDEKEAVEREFNLALGIKSDSIRSSVLNKPKDLEKRDFAWLKPDESDLFMRLGDYDDSPAKRTASLAKMGIFQPLFSIPGGFYVSLKANGTRYYLFSGQKALYLIEAKNREVTQISGPGTSYGRFFNLLPGTILDVEALGEVNPDGTFDSYEFLVFDILAHHGQIVQELSYTERLQHIETVLSFFNNEQKLESRVQENVAALKAKNPELKIKDSGRPFGEIFKLQAKPVWRLPTPSAVDTSTPVSKHQQLRALAKEFFAILGAAAEKARLSNSEGNTILIKRSGENGETEVEIDPIPQKTGPIEWYADGLIFTPADRPYLEKSDLFRQNNPKDASHNFSLVRKWKEVMTIDFRVVRAASGQFLLLSGDSKQTEVQFSDDDYPWNGKFESEGLKENTIYEFYWAYSDRFSDFAFIPVRERLDRRVPNPLKTAQAIWRLINDPITPDDLAGKTLFRMRRYHNRVKTALLSELAEKTGVPILLDIGSGRGGDLPKWKKFSKVYAVEPDIQNIREFVMRNRRLPTPVYSEHKEEAAETDESLKTAHYNNRARLHPCSKTKPRNKFSSIIPINTAGEDLLTIKEKIGQSRVNCVTVFNALTFFYDSLAHFNQLLETITQCLIPGGYCYMIAFDGELLLNSFQGGSQPESETMSIQTPNLTIAKASDPSCRKIWIEIRGGIVRGQFEYLINTREMVQIMDVRGFKLLEEHYLNEETLLSEEEYWFSSMFKVLKFRYLANEGKRDLTEILIPFKQNMEADRVISPLEPSDPPQEIISQQLGLVGGRILRFGNPQDGSCYIHGVLRATSRHYKSLTVAEKTDFVIRLRLEIAAAYTPEIHERIGNGFFRQSQVPAYSYENIKRSLSQTSFWISFHLLGFIGDQLNANVYILRGIDPVVYVFGDTSDHIKPGRPNIVLLWINDNHYETVGILEGQNQVRTVFADNHPLILAIRR